MQPGNRPGVGHGLRQAANSQFLLEVIGLWGKAEYKQALQRLTTEELAAIRLTAYLFRAGRTNENSAKSDPSNAIRSALVFIGLTQNLNLFVKKCFQFGHLVNLNSLIENIFCLDLEVLRKS